jgi:hypothetical protein
MKNKEIEENDIKLFANLITNRHLIEDSDKLLWKDFLLYFKNVFQNEVGNIYTGKISVILKKLLNINQDLHVRKGIKLTFREWLDLYSI